MANDVDLTLPQFTVVIQEDGSLITLPVLTVSASQTNKGDGVINLHQFSMTVTALQGTIDGTTINLPTFTISTRAGLTVPILLPQMTLAGSGFPGHKGDFDRNLPRMTINVKGTVQVRGTFDVSLPAFTLANTVLTGNISLASTRNLPLLGLSAHAFRGENGDADLTFPIFTMTTESFQSINGTVVQSLKMLTLDAFADSYTNRII